MSTLLQTFKAVGKWLHREFVAAWPVFLFFLVGFVLLFSLIKLALADFSIQITAFSQAVIGALVAAKAVLILDETPLARSLDHYRRIVAIAAKTFFYGLITLLLGYIERTLDALHKVHNFAAAIRYMLDHADRYRIFAWALGVSLVFAFYFAFVEISERMGKGALWSLFFQSPQIAGNSGRHSD